jgi:hypothetical protein
LIGPTPNLDVRLAKIFEWACGITSGSRTATALAGFAARPECGLLLSATSVKIMFVKSGSNWPSTTRSSFLAS